MNFDGIYLNLKIYVRRLIPLVLSVAIAGCSVGRTQPEVVETEPTTPPPSQQSIEMVRALSQLSALKEDLKQMRNAVEQMQFQQENANRRQEDLFQDIDRRLLSLEDQVQSASRQTVTPSDPSANVLVDPDTGQLLAEGQTGIGPSVVNQVDQTDIAATTGNTGTPAGNQVGTVTVVDATTTRSVTGSQVDQSIQQSSNANSQGSTSVSLTEQQAYESAFDLLKQSRYEDAIKQFDALVNTWPNSELADDALYWKSEANYVNREFEAALNGFRSIVERYPDSSRLPEAMLKVGYIQYDIGAYDQAAKTFQDILSRFPGHQVTVSADTRLRRIQQTIQ